MFSIFMVNAMGTRCDKPKTVPVNLQSVANQVTEVDLSQLVQAGRIELIQGVFIDNLDGAQFDMECDVTGQRFRVLAGAQMVVQLLCTDTAKFILSFDDVGSTRLQFVNFPVMTQLF